MLIALVLAAACAPQQAAGCAGCHAAARDAELPGAHARVVSCVDCHGGNAKETDKDRAHGPNYKTALARPALPALCGTCHADTRRMNPFGIPTDQLAQYRTSRHGEALARGVLQAAVCTDCHGAHGILRARDPRSPVHASRVPATCGRCHGNRELMEKLGHSWTAETEYRAGVHGELLLGKGDPAAPHCATCHGNHGASPPGFAEVGRVCGKCHVKQVEMFETSPHAFYAKDGSFKGCVVCHANHRIVTSVPAMMGRCTPCHEAPDKEMKNFTLLEDFIARTRGDYARTSDRVAQAARAGRFTDDEQLALEKAKTSLLQLPPLQHALSQAKVAALAGTISSELGEVDLQLDRQERTERWKKLALIPIWVFLVGMAWLFRAKRRQIERRGP
ncbi:MAG: hypothetical protein HY293_04310 [Planctomycetes bacterium]|nr:hypothetical protein [Planctomycetota bacterium]